MCFRVYAICNNEMNNENKTIHDFDFNLICEFFSSMERQGPGSPDVTLKALDFVDNLTEESSIADIGCGTGGQTMNAPLLYTLQQRCVYIYFAFRKTLVIISGFSVV